jgi:hypothetical protein
MPSSGKSSGQTVRNSAKHLRSRFRRHHQQCPDSRIWKSPRILFQGQCETEESYQRLSFRSNHPLELRSDASSLLFVGPGPEHSYFTSAHPNRTDVFGAFPPAFPIEIIISIFSPKIASMFFKYIFSVVILGMIATGAMTAPPNHQGSLDRSPRDI